MVEVVGMNEQELRSEVEFLRKRIEGFEIAIEELRKERNEQHWNYKALAQLNTELKAECYDWRKRVEALEAGEVAI